MAHPSEDMDHDIEEEFLKFQRDTGQLNEFGWDHSVYQPNEEEIDFLNESGVNEDPDDLPFCACCFGGECRDPTDSSLKHKNDWDSALQEALGDLDLGEDPSAEAEDLAEAKHSESPSQSAPLSPPPEKSELRASAAAFVPSWLPASTASAAGPARGAPTAAAGAGHSNHGYSNHAPAGPVSGNRLCRFKDGCKKPDCRFDHPQPFMEELCESTKANKIWQNPHGDYSHSIPIYRPCQTPNCTFDRCPFQHDQALPPQHAPQAQYYPNQGPQPQYAQPPYGGGFQDGMARGGHHATPGPDGMDGYHYSHHPQQHHQHHPQHQHQSYYPMGGNAGGVGGDPGIMQQRY